MLENGIALPDRIVEPPSAAELFLSHYAFVMRTAFRFAPQPDIVDDILQETFRRFVQSAENYDLMTDVRPLLVTITKNVAFRHWEQRQRERTRKARLIAEHIRLFGEREAHAEPMEPLEPERETRRSELQGLEHCLGELSPKSRNIIDLHYRQHWKYNEIAEEFQTTAEAVKQFVFRIRNKLRSCIDRFLRK